MSCIKNKVICFKVVDPDNSDFFSFSLEFCVSLAMVIGKYLSVSLGK